MYGFSIVRDHTTDAERPFRLGLPRTPLQSGWCTAADAFPWGPGRKSHLIYYFIASYGLSCVLPA